MNKGDISTFLAEIRNIGGILNFVENDQLVLSGMTENKSLHQYLLYFVDVPLNHFYYYFLAGFEQKLYDAIVLRGEKLNLNQFSSLLHSHLRNRYLKNMYGDEKHLWNTNGKSLDKTISHLFKSYNPQYIEYLYEKGYKQLAELAIDIYLYYPVFNCETEFQNFMVLYIKFLKTDWKPMSFDNIKPLESWLYGSYLKSNAKEEQNHNIVQM